MPTVESVPATAKRSAPNDVEPYHTGRAAVYDRIGHLIRRGWSLDRVLAVCDESLAEAEREAERCHHRDHP